MRLGAGRGRPTEGRAADNGDKHNARPVWSELNWQKLQANACGASWLGHRVLSCPLASFSGRHAVTTGRTALCYALGWTREACKLECSAMARVAESEVRGKYI